jgi:hypothetical protein
MGKVVPGSLDERIENKTRNDQWDEQEQVGFVIVTSHSSLPLIALVS